MSADEDVPGTRAVKMAALTFAALVLFGLVGGFAVALVETANPACENCGLTVGLSTTWALFLAFLPVLWMRHVPKGRRIVIWLQASVVGLVIYWPVHSTAYALGFSGALSAEAASSLAGLSAVGWWIGGGVAWWLMRRAQPNAQA